MKKILMMAIAVLAMIGLATPGFAGQYNKSGGVGYWTYEGEVIKLIPYQGALIVKDKEDGQEIHIHVDKETLSDLKVGDVISFKMQGSMCMVDRVTKR